jgi:hypothetical protein
MYGLRMESVRRMLRCDKSHRQLMSPVVAPVAASFAPCLAGELVVPPYFTNGFSAYRISSLHGHSSPLSIPLALADLSLIWTSHKVFSLLYSSHPCISLTRRRNLACLMILHALFYDLSRLCATSLVRFRPLYHCNDYSYSIATRQNPCEAPCDLKGGDDPAPNGAPTN